MDKNKNSNLIVKCPKCFKEFKYYESKNRPFCSLRCSDIDLGNWFQEQYSTPVQGPLEADEEGELLRLIEDKYSNDL